jgi:hypothetical protein
MEIRTVFRSFKLTLESLVRTNGNNIADKGGNEGE